MIAAIVARMLMLVIASAWHPASINTMRREPEAGSEAAEAAEAGTDIARTIGNEGRPSITVLEHRSPNPVFPANRARAPA